MFLMRYPLPKQQGFTLIEVLIATLVLSVGLLGLAGLNAVSVKMNHSAYLRSQATNLAYEIVDAIRANPASDYTGSQKPTTCDTDFSRANTDIKTDDLNEWANNLACLLPRGQGNISESGTDPVITTVTICWDEQSIPGEDTPDSVCTTENLAGTSHYQIKVQL